MNKITSSYLSQRAFNQAQLQFGKCGISRGCPQALSRSTHQLSQMFSACVSSQSRMPSVRTFSGAPLHQLDLGKQVRYCSSENDITQTTRVIETVNSEGDRVYRIFLGFKLDRATWKDKIAGPLSEAGFEIVRFTDGDHCYESPVNEASHNAVMAIEKHLESEGMNVELDDQVDMTELMTIWANKEEEFIENQFNVSIDLPYSDESSQLSVADTAEESVDLFLKSDDYQRIVKKIPKGVDPVRFTSNIRRYLIETYEDLSILDFNSVKRAIHQCAILGLEPNSELRYCYLISVDCDLRLFMGYKGLIELSSRTGNVSDVYSNVVYRNDKFGFDLEKKTFEHAPHYPPEEAGDITFVYAVCTFKDGTQEVVVIDRRRIEVAKKKRSSKGSKYSPWFTWFGEMAKKTAVKSLIKRIALSRTTKYYPSE